MRLYKTLGRKDDARLYLQRAVRGELDLVFQRPDVEYRQRAIELLHLAPYCGREGRRSRAAAYVQHRRRAVVLAQRLIDRLQQLESIPTPHN